jgi:hypothetical protein
MVTLSTLILASVQFPVQSPQGYGFTNMLRCNIDFPVLVGQYPFRLEDMTRGKCEEIQLDPGSVHELTAGTAQSVIMLDDPRQFTVQTSLTIVLSPPGCLNPPSCDNGGKTGRMHHPQITERLQVNTWTMN